MRVKSRSLSNNTDENASLIDGDVGDENFCQEVVKQTIDEFGKIDILVNNAAEQHLNVFSDQGDDETFEEGLGHHQYDICDGVQRRRLSSTV